MAGVDNTNDSAPTVPDENANGIWLGATSSRVYGISDTLGLLHDSEFIALNIDFNKFFKGSYSVNQDDISATWLGYILNVSNDGTGTLNGVISSQETMLATAEASIGATSNLELY